MTSLLTTIQEFYLHVFKMAFYGILVVLATLIITSSHLNTSRNNRTLTKFMDERKDTRPLNTLTSLVTQSNNNTYQTLVESKNKNSRSVKLVFITNYIHNTGSSFYNSKLKLKDDFLKAKHLSDGAYQQFVNPSIYIMLDLQDIYATKWRQYGLEFLKDAQLSGFKRIGIILEISACATLIKSETSHKDSWSILNFILFKIEVNDKMLTCGIEAVITCVQGIIEKCEKGIPVFNSNLEVFYEVKIIHEGNNSSQDTFATTLRPWTVTKNTTVLLQEAGLSQKIKNITTEWVLAGRNLVTNTSYYLRASDLLLNSQKHDQSLSTKSQNNVVTGQSSILHRSIVKSGFKNGRNQNLSFSQTNFGVGFNPELIKNDEYMTYDAKDLYPFITLISQRFGTIFTPAFTVKQTGKHWSNVPEVVAKFNRNHISSSDRNKSIHLPAIQVFLEVELESLSDVWRKVGEKTHFEYAKELANTANLEFEETVPYVLLRKNHIEDFNVGLVVSQIDAVIRTYTRNNDSTFGLGVTINLNDCAMYYENNFTELLFTKFPVVVFRLKPKRRDLERTDERFFMYLKSEVEQCLNIIRTVEPSLKVGLHTGWPDRNMNGRINVTSLVWLWKQLNIWAVENDVIVFVDSAFDEPRSDQQLQHHTGWWKLVSDGYCYGSTNEYIFQEKLFRTMNEADDITAGLKSIQDDLDKHSNNTIMLAYHLVHLKLLQEEPDNNPNGLQRLFSRQNFGTMLSLTLSKNAEDRDYSKEDIEFLLSLVRTRFSRILMDNVHDYTIKSSSSLRYIPSVAAKGNNRTFFNDFKRNPDNTLNFQRAKLLRISIPFELFVGDDNDDVRASFDIAKTLADKANSIFPQTVEYLLMIYSVTRSFQDYNRTATRMTIFNESIIYFKHQVEQNQYKNNSVLSYKLGAILYGDECLDVNNFSKLVDDILPHVQIVFMYYEGFGLQGDDFFQKEKNKFERCERKVKNKFPNLTSGIIYNWFDTSQSYESLKRLVNFWLEMNNYATDKNILVFMEEAFDDAQMKEKNGWWRIIKSEYNNKLYLEEKYQYIYNSTAFRQDRESNPTTVDSSNFKLIAAIVSVSVVCATVVVIVVLVVSKYRRVAVLLGLSEEEILEFFEGRNKSKIEDGETGDDNDYSKITALFDSYAYDQSLEVEKNAFTLGHKTEQNDIKLGAGAFGQVCLGRVRLGDTEIIVAVKQVNSVGTSDESLTSLRSLLSEIKLMSHLDKHENVVGLLGAHTSNLRKGEVYAFLELCSLGSLKKYLKGLRQPEDDTTTDPYTNLNENAYDINPLEKWSLDIVNGMEFLASKQVVHADLATRNILLDTNKKAKISDFGLSRRMMNYQSYIKTQQEPLPWKWMSPESLRCLIFNEKTDVWAFGVTLWEIYTLGEVPYAGMSWNVDFASLLEDGLRLPVPKHQERPLFGNKNIYPIMGLCWETNPAKRPSFQQLKQGIFVHWKVEFVHWTKVEISSKI